MHICERFVRGKHSDADCEDGIVVTDNMILVADGATAKRKGTFDGASPGAFAKNVICDFAVQNGVDKLECVEFFAAMSNALKEASDACVDSLVFEQYPRASVIVYNAVFNQVWSYGDCQCMINNQLYARVIDIDVINANMRSLCIEQALAKGASLEDIAKNDVGRAAIIPNLECQYLFENVEGQYGYPVINGFEINHNMIDIYHVSTSDEVVLASDGYPVLKNTLTQSEQCLSDIIAKDPLCYKLHKATKGILQGNVSFDDRCYCRFVV